MIIMGQSIYSFSKELYFECITDKWRNFTKGKIYKAKALGALAKKVNDKTMWTDFKIIDDEGDDYIVTWHEISRNYFKAVTNNGEKLYARRGPNVGSGIGRRI